MIDLERCCDVEVVVVGDLMLDEYVWGSVTRISPEAPVPIMRVERRTYLPGGAANAAVGVAVLGARSVLVGVTGADDAGDQLRAGAKDRGVDVSGVIVDDARPTTTKTRFVAHNQHVVRADVETHAPLTGAVEDKLMQRVASAVESADVVVISDYAKGVMTEAVTRMAIRSARGAATPVVVDPKGLRYEQYRGATILTPNLDDAARAANLHVRSEADVEEVAARLRAICDGSAVLVTRGADGMTFFGDGSSFSVKAEAQEIFDVTGAGDTVVAVLAVLLGAGADFQESVRLANTAAGLAVAKVGTAVVTREEIELAVYSRDTSGSQGRTGVS